MPRKAQRRLDERMRELRVNDRDPFTKTGVRQRRTPRVVWDQNQGCIDHTILSMTQVEIARRARKNSMIPIC